MIDFLHLQYLKADLQANVSAALLEDVGDGDITARLIPANEQASAGIITREDAIICGVDWVNEVARQVDASITIDWMVADGQMAEANQLLFQAHGNARSLLTFERCALNFLQCLSGTASIAHYYASLVADTKVKLLDTRKTIPGLRKAQKYAVACGQCYNHRIGLYDAFLIKENHIAACGGIASAISTARLQEPSKPVEVEVESMGELQQALDAGADRIMLDNFTLREMRDSVALAAGRAELEASGGITEQTLRPIAETGVDYISIGALTKDCRAIDLSMRFA
ncbi:MAG: carboxylating nicotinate-nucleotide diphosphorylase [Oceanospirillaceae bacterium]|mgnify:FL=1|jgi:nicotinate-nucleotide pyrophosphorylase (carboxylating)|nr:carboxylating nicotinate-nucleotide diphosphorylase [Oceanospirillaceae bacterium]MBT4443039.1 carboxylating nicotinate-nucleotide diphosphorylase [Oceanospirillaceae bacterium]MBT6077992.1 carboxylating nicotinate-nucleotide diphosphorylase [Oceanospirillaceae bacterium]MBT7329432.1 carboxylating nicotinate-nucleotide diphosphorylase [Oceanospirillaceae bacterium]